MHTDDDIFESLNIGGSGSDPKEPPAKGPENDAVRKSADLSAESRIFEGEKVCRKAGSKKAS